jgi:hypothetical protein
LNIWFLFFWMSLFWSPFIKFIKLCMYIKIQMWPQYLFIHKLRSRPFLLITNSWKYSPNGFNSVSSYMCTNIVDMRIPCMDANPSMVPKCSSSLIAMTSKVLKLKVPALCK